MKLIKPHKVNLLKQDNVTSKHNVYQHNSCLRSSFGKLLNYTNKISRGRYDIDEKQVQLWFSNKAPVGGKKNCAPTHTSMAHET
jgi:hypothetical protein